ncbi:transcriptional regulator [Mycolicibacterium fortuitum]|uniref:Transcriptional regulator n=2 Tax=Mycobacteriaceae TaxID=1762 RepID=A0ABD6QMT9_MYCFO|nr:transcriptional regulator [Mycolicibacterium fortuitum]
MPRRRNRHRPQKRCRSRLSIMELLGQRWVLRVVWELEPGPVGFLELRRRMGNCSSSMLSERLQQLATAGLVVKNESGAWELTDAGAGLGAALSGVWDWSESWKAGRGQQS